MNLSTTVMLLLHLTNLGSVRVKARPDSVKVNELNEVVISASRVSERIFQSPVSIEKVNSAYFKQAAAPSFFDAIENIKGVQMITPSLGFRVINTRGFANTTNVRFAQMTDGADMQAPHIGSAIGNSLGPTDLDIESVEIIPGSASALYGMNTINGLANFTTKNPFKSPGISFQQKVGLNNTGTSNGFTETSVRIAHVVSPKVAFKVNAALSRGRDWIANDGTGLNSLNSSTGLTGAANPAFDAVNSYGNESSNRRTLTLGGKSYYVARTGYRELDVADYSLRNIKGDAGLYYRTRKQGELTYTYHFALLNNIYQRSNRFRLEDYFLQQHSLQYKGNIFQLRAYLNTENTGKSYNLRSAAENIDRDFKKDDPWFADYTSGFNKAVNDGRTVADAHVYARSVADAGRYQPGSEDFKNALTRLSDINNWDIGAALRVESKLFHSEGLVNVSDKLLPWLSQKAKLDVLAGFDHRTYFITPDGNYFINPIKGKESKDIVYGKTGGFVSLSKYLFNGYLKLGASARLDKSAYFAATLNPRITAVFTPVSNHNFRVSYQNGYRFPSIFEAYSNVNSGGVKRVGGLPVMSTGIFENSYIRASIDAFQLAISNDVNKGISKSAAIENNKNLLKKNSYTYLKPERINSFELGYKGLILNSRLFADVDFYYNSYQNFIAQVEVNIPKTNNADSITFYLSDKKLQDRYRMWTNSKSKVYDFGGSFGLSYRVYKNYKAFANISLAKLHKKNFDDGLEDGFNTPKWITNVTLSNDDVYKKWGFGLTYKWQSSYYWQSFLVNGEVPAYYTIDAKVSHVLKRLPLSVAAGASNLLDTKYNSFLGGPALGAFYYTSLTYALK